MKKSVTVRAAKMALVVLLALAVPGIHSLASDNMNTYLAVFIIDGVVYDSTMADYGEPIPLPNEPPEKEGYTFSGWSEIPAAMPVGGVDITGSYLPNSYTIIYTVDGEEYKRVPCQYGERISAIEEPVKAGYIFSGWSAIPETMPAGNVEVLGTFSKKPRELERIDITSPPYAGTNPTRGLFFDPRGMVITAYYDDGSADEIPVTNALINSGTVTVSPSRFDRTGRQEVTVGYDGKTDSITLTVADRTPVSISVTKKPDKTEYVAGEPLSLAGGEIRVNYNNDTQSFVNMTDSSVAVSGYSANQTGTQKLTVTYSNAGKKFTGSFSVTVIDKPRTALGDVNGDRKINALDLLKIQRHILALQKLTGIYADAADVNRDGKVNALDLLKTQRHILNIQKLS